MVEPIVIVGFDVDGCIIDSFKPHFMAFNYLIGQYGLPPMDAEKYKQINFDYKLVYLELGIKDEIAKLNEIYWPVFNMLIRELKPRLVPNAREVLYFLSQNISRLILITNQSEENIKFYDSYNNFLVYFNETIYVKCPLNKYEALKALKNKYNSDNIIFIFVSDAPDDLLYAQMAGWKVYGLPKYSFSSEANLQAAIQRGNGGSLQDIYEFKEMFLDDNGEFKTPR